MTQLKRVDFQNGVSVRIPVSGFHIEKVDTKQCPSHLLMPGALKTFPQDLPSPFVSEILTPSFQKVEKGGERHGVEIFMDDAWLQEIHNLRMGGDTFAKGLNITTPYQSSLGTLLCFVLGV